MLELRSCVRVEVDVLRAPLKGSPSPDSVDVKQLCTRSLPVLTKGILWSYDNHFMFGSTEGW